MKGYHHLEETDRLLSYECRSETVASKLDESLSFDETCNGRNHIIEVNLDLERVSGKENCGS